MKRKEAIIRYLALVSRADRHLIANYIIASLRSVSFKLSELKRSGLVHNMKWSDGSKVWVLTPEGYRRHGLLPAPRQKARSISSDRNGVMS